MMMMKGAVLCLLVAALMMTLARAQTTCGSGLQCFNGTCVDNSEGINVCSCHSGYVGSSCTVLASSATCPVSGWELLTNLATTSVPEMVLPADGGRTAVTRGRMRLDVRSPFTFDRHNSFVEIQNSANPQCSYPGPYWRKENDNSGCRDTFFADMPFDLALGCGWEERTSRDYRTLTGDVMVTHSDLIDSFRGVPIMRTTRQVLPVRMRFPLAVTVSTDVTVTSAFDLLAAITLQEFLPSNRTGMLGVTTSLQSPYELVMRGVAAHPSGIEVAPWMVTGDLNCPALPSASACLQETFLALTPDASVCAFTGRYELAFSVRCRAPAPNATSAVACPLVGTETATIILDVTSEDFCTDIDVDIGLSATLDSFEDALWQTPRTAYVHDARAHFRGQLFSDAGVAALSSASVQKVVVTYGPSARQMVLLAGGSATSTGRAVDIAVTTQQTDTIGFAFDVLESMFPLYAGDGSSFTVTAELRVTYVPPNRPANATEERAGGVHTIVFRAPVAAAGEQTIDESAQVVVQAPPLPSAPSGSEEEDEGSTSAGAVAGIAGGAVLAGVVAFAALCCGAIAAIAIIVVVSAISGGAVASLIPAGLLVRRRRRRASGSEPEDEEFVQRSSLMTSSADEMTPRL